MSTEVQAARAPSFSIIVPVLDEEKLVVPFLRHLRRRAPGAEIIVVDGGSHDDTVALVQGRADLVLHAPPGRARQMNAGAAAARGDALWFLHVDSRLPPGPLTAMTAALTDPGTVGGCFRLRFPRREWVYRVSDSLGNVAVDLFRIALGDHGIFCRRAAFERAGGYPDVPLMEDANLYRALRRQGGRMRQLPSHIVSSPRRYEQLGPVRTTAYYLLILGLYVGGVKIETLQAIYRSLTRSEKRARNGEEALPKVGFLVRGETRPALRPGQGAVHQDADRAGRGTFSARSGAPPHPSSRWDRPRAGDGNTKRASAPEKPRRGRAPEKGYS